MDALFVTQTAGAWLLAAGALLAAAGCAPSRGKPEPVREPASQAATARGQTVPGPKPLYYSDLGPDTVDVSRYPAAQKRNYQIYALVCSRCHTLARSINSPVASRSYWEMYLLGMRAASVLKDQPPITAGERKAILDFLAYDSRVRKIQRSREFDAATAALMRRYEPILREEVRRLQEDSQPALLPSER